MRTNRYILALVVPTDHLNTAKIVEFPVVLHNYVFSLEIPNWNLGLSVSLAYQTHQISFGVQFHKTDFAQTC